MSRSYAYLQRQSTHVLDALNRIDRTSEAAEVTDEAGHWGVDGWIRVIHDLLDIQIRALASLTENTINGPWWREDDDDCYEIDSFRIAHRSYARRIEIVEPFRRVGSDHASLDNEDEIAHDAAPDPVILPAGGRHFRITASPKGFNYRGTVRVCEDCESPRPSRTFIQVVTVGL